MKKRVFPILLLAVALAGPPTISGCSGQQETTTTTVQPADSNSATPGATTSTTTTSNEPDSVVGATLNAVGTIILFPFRLIGDALGLIF
ncbi:MAG: hypothetical protein ACYDC3_14415 [Candidatus Binataceae bacterium]